MNTENICMRYEKEQLEIFLKGSESFTRWLVGVEMRERVQECEISALASLLPVSAKSSNTFDCSS